MPSEALKRDILKEVAKHDGEWSWYNLDRRLLGVHPGEGLVEIMVAVQELAASGLIEIRPNASVGTIPCCWITESGRAILCPPDSN
jgi:hypothetical protein